MLRSLVGSEMCIRDSGYTAGLCLTNLVVPAAPSRRQRSVLRSPGWPSTCLLYTSDAADDLLCVDLGGRRIIKKQKNKRRCLR